MTVKATPLSAVFDALNSLKVAPLLDGFRGGASVEKSNVVSAILQVAQYAENNADRLVELDVNPLMLTPQGPVAADALMVYRR